MRAHGAAARGGLLVGVAAAVTVLDQSTKSWAQTALASGDRHHVIATLYLVLTYNRGAAFSLGSGAGPLIEALAVVLATAVLWLSGRLAQGRAGTVTLVAFGLVLGGALSNLADRFLRTNHGSVIDFVQLVSWWPVFNLADAAITAGALTVAVQLALSAFRPEAASAPPPPPPPVRAEDAKDAE
jgi:signal peptidase II